MNKNEKQWSVNVFPICKTNLYSDKRKCFLLREVKVLFVKH